MMKKIFKFFGCLVMMFSLLLGMTSCAEPDSGNSNDQNTEEEGNQDNEEQKVYTIAEMLELCEADTGERYLVRGVITEIIHFSLL